MEHKVKVDSAGFASIEAIAAITFVAFTVSGGSALTYFAFARNWLERSAYEANVCMASREPKRACEIQFRQSARTALPIGELENLKLTQEPQEVRTEAKFFFQDKEIFHVADKRSLPFQSEHRRGRR
jgi:hypothetical protein